MTASLRHTRKLRRQTCAKRAETRGGARCWRFIRTVNRVGYAFGGSLATERAAPTPAAPLATIHWVEINDRRLRLHAGENLIGRAADAEVWLDEVSISRRHATIVVGDGTAELRDLGSKNGTRTNDVRLDGPVSLADRDRIGIGNVTILYRRAPGGPPTETQGG